MSEVTRKLTTWEEPQYRQGPDGVVSEARSWGNEIIGTSEDGVRPYMIVCAYESE